MPENTGNYYVQNGRIVDSAGFSEDFLQLPTYIYEVFRVIDGIPLFLPDHLDRLGQTTMLTGYKLPYTWQDLNAWVRKLIEVNRLTYGNIKIVFLPVGADIQHDADKRTNTSASSDPIFGERHGDIRMYIIEHQYPTPAQFRDGVAVKLFHGIRENPNAKVMDVELRHQTNQTKQADEVYEVLLVDDDGCITEGSRSNVFFVFGDRVVTPLLQDVLPGITRKHIMACCLDKSIPISEEKMPVLRLAEADAAFLSGTSRKVLPINRIGDLMFDPANAVIGNVQHAFNNRVTVHLLRESLGS